MIWPFKRRKSQSTQTEQGHTRVDTDAAGTGQPPSLSAFSFSSLRAAEDPEQPSESTVDAFDGDTAVEVKSVAAVQQLQDVVRERSAPRRQFTFKERGVRPLLIPSLREHTTCIRLVAESQGYDQPVESIESWKEYLSFCPRDLEAWFALGQRAVTVEDFALAQRAFEHVIDLDGQHGLAHGALGFVSAYLGHWEQALASYRRAVNLRPNCEDMKMELARVYEQVGEIELAEELWQQLDPSK